MSRRTTTYGPSPLTMFHVKHLAVGRPPRRHRPHDDHVRRRLTGCRDSQATRSPRQEHPPHESRIVRVGPLLASPVLTGDYWGPHGSRRGASSVPIEMFHVKRCHRPEHHQIGVPDVSRETSEEGTLRGDPRATWVLRRRLPLLNQELVGGTGNLARTETQSQAIKARLVPSRRGVRGFGDDQHSPHHQESRRTFGRRRRGTKGP